VKSQRPVSGKFVVFGPVGDSPETGMCVGYSEVCITQDAGRSKMDPVMKTMVGAGVRYVLTWLSGYLMARGVADAATAASWVSPEFVGAVTTVAVGGWAFVANLWHGRNATEVKGTV
jgi:hypothetical protein